MARPDVILHIGPHKTGTSALQDFLFVNRNALREHGIHYRPTGDWNNHHTLANRFQTGIDQASGRKLLETLLEEAAGGRLLLSSEMFCQREIDVAAVRDCLSGVDLTVVGYVRHPCDLALSAYNQLVRSPKARWQAPLDPSRPPYDVSLLSALGRWEGVERLVLCPYDRMQWPKGSLAEDFMAQIGVDTHGLQKTAVAVNKSLPHPFLEALRTLNGSGMDESSRMRIIEILADAECAPGDYPLSESFQTVLFEQMRRGLERFAAYLRPGFDTAYLFQPRGGLMDFSRREA